MSDKAFQILITVGIWVYISIPVIAVGAIVYDWVTSPYGRNWNKDKD